MKKVLRAINALPWDLGIDHYFPLHDMPVGTREISLVESEGWDLLRATGGQFFIPDNREQWIEMCNSPIVHDSNSGDLPNRAASIDRFCADNGVGKRIFSVGVGLAALEYHISKSSPGISLFCSDFGDEAVRRLKSVFLECDDIRGYDLVRQSFREVFPEGNAGDLLLIHRVDPHLSDVEWFNVFQNLAKDGVGDILFVPHRLLDLRYLKYSKQQELVHRVRGTTLAYSGRVRTLRRWSRIWGGSYSVKERVAVGYSSGFYLRPKMKV